MRVRSRGVRGPLSDWTSFDRWVSAVVLTGSGVAAVILNQLSGLLGFYALDCRAEPSGLFGAVFWLVTAGPSVSVALCSAAAAWSAARGRRSWPAAVAAATVIAVIVAVSDPLARWATSGC